MKKKNKRKLIDSSQFKDLPVSRQRKLQLAYKRDGLCVACGKPAVTAGSYCAFHAVKNREYHRRRIAAKTRYFNSASYNLDDTNGSGSKHQL